MGERAVLQARHKDHREFETFGGVDSHEGDLSFAVVPFGELI